MVPSLAVTHHPSTLKDGTELSQVPGQREIHRKIFLWQEKGHKRKKEEDEMGG